VGLRRSEVLLLGAETAATGLVDDRAHMPVVLSHGSYDAFRRLADQGRYEVD
jgi:hypothetical protein